MYKMRDENESVLKPEWIVLPRQEVKISQLDTPHAFLQLNDLSH